MHKETERLIEAILVVLKGYRPMTVRQIYYQLVSRQVIENRASEYNKLKRVLTFTRRQRLIPWGWVEDRLRRPQVVSM